MLKIISSVIVGLSLIGCSTQLHTHKHMKRSMSSNMYQSVTPKEAILVQKGENKSSCSVCGMNLVKFYKTSHSATVNGQKRQYCSIHCVANQLKHGVDLKDIQVVDVKSLKFIPVSKAFYVVGSSKGGTMSRVSKYAFASLDNAKEFQTQFGGKIMDFKAALEVANEDFKK